MSRTRSCSFGGLAVILVEPAEVVDGLPSGAAPLKRAHTYDADLAIEIPPVEQSRSDKRSCSLPAVISIDQYRPVPLATFTADAAVQPVQPHPMSFDAAKYAHLLAAEHSAAGQDASVVSSISIDDDCEYSSCSSSDSEASYSMKAPQEYQPPTGISVSSPPPPVVISIVSVSNSQISRVYEEPVLVVESSAPTAPQLLDGINYAPTRMRISDYHQSRQQAVRQHSIEFRQQRQWIDLSSSARPSPSPSSLTRSFTCGICQEESLYHLGVLFGAHLLSYHGGRSQCQHRYCKDCIKAFLEHEVTDGKVLQIRCPGINEKTNAPCLCIAPSSWIKLQVGGEIYAKYERFLKLKKDDSYRSCPNHACLHVQQRGSSDQMTCEKCQTAYCFSHDLAHPNMPCGDYRKKLAHESKDSLAHIRDSTVKCPWPLCRVNCIKESGCNHMTCSQCSSEFCYLCGGYYFGGLHFAPCNIFGCPGLKSDDLPANSRNTVFRSLLFYFIGLPLLVGGFFLALALFLAVESIYLVWAIAGLPLWIIWTICLYTCLRNSSNLYTWERRLGRCITWGPRIVRAILN